MSEEKHYCKCLCGKEIIIKPHHKYYGIPEYICGHNTKGFKFGKRTLEQINIMKESFKNRKYKNKICETCGITFTPVSSRENWCKKCSKEKRKNYMKEHHKKAYWKNVDISRVKKSKRQRKRQKELREEILNKLGNKCTQCGNDNINTLQIDHPNGGGTKEIKSFKMQRIPYYKHILKYLLENPNQNEYQLLCANCNWIKRSTNNEIKRKYN